jgi:TolB-like protein/DNA-binding winged helix-turn-helix (wHTH) protein/Tfp pilus assembly protein PilF
MANATSLSNPSARRFRFDEFEVDVLAGQLLRDGRKIPLPGKPFELLVILLQHPAEVVTREALRNRLWSNGTFVEFDDSLNHAVRSLREALGDVADSPRFIETLPRHGYRFLRPVECPAVRRRRIPTTASAVLLVALAAAAGFAIWHALRPARFPGRIMLAVLPLDNLSGDREQEFLADSLTEELTTELGRLNPQRLGVIARTSVMHFKGTKKTVSEIAKELHVDYVVEGGVRMAEHRLRISMQLIRVRDQSQVWAYFDERKLDEILTVQHALAEQTAQRLSVELAPGAQQHLGSAFFIDPEAEEKYLRGRFLLGRRTGGAMKLARDYFQDVTKVEPSYADAYSGLATAWLMMANYSLVPASEALPHAKAAAQKALELDPLNAEPRTILAEIHSELEWDVSNGEKEFRQVIQDNPNYVLAHQWHAACLWASGRFDEAIDEMTKAFQLNPLSLGAMVDLGRAYYFARQTDRAIEQYEKVIEIDPNYASAHSMLGMALLEKHEYDRGIAEIQKGMAITSGRSVWLAYAFAVAGREAEARQALDDCLKRWNELHTGGVCMALGYLGLGDKELAFTWLEKEFQEHTSTIYMLKAYPYWDGLRSDPRYWNLLRRAGLHS